MRKLPKSKSISIRSSFATSRNGIRAICRATSKGYTIKLLPTSFQRGSKGGKRNHRRLAGRLVAVRRTADIAVVATRPHPMPVLWRDQHREDAADDAVFKHVVVLPDWWELAARLRISVIISLASQARPPETLQ